MQELGLVPNSELDFPEYQSYYLTWYEGEYNSIPYEEPLSVSQGVNGDSNFEVTEGIGTWNWFGEYESYYGDYWGGGEAYSDGRYQEDSSYQEQEDGYPGSINDYMEQDYSETQWFGYGDFGLDGEDLYYQGSPEFQYNSSWDEWEETKLYEQIFGD